MREAKKTAEKGAGNGSTSAATDVQTVEGHRYLDVFNIKTTGLSGKPNSMGSMCGYEFPEAKNPGM